MKAIKTYNHNPSTWVVTLDEYNQVGTFVWGNTEGDFYSSLPENIKIKNGIYDEPTSDASDPNYDAAKRTAFEQRVAKLFNSKAQEVIDGILRNKTVRINQHVNFDWLLDFTKIELRKAIYHTLQDSIRNHWSEVKTSSSFNTDGLSINNDLTNWIISAQQRNTAAWNALGNSKIDKYSMQSYGETSKRFISEDSTTIVLQDFNYDELGKNLGSFTTTLADAISTFTSADKYDFIILIDDSKIKEDQVYRYQGGDILNEDNWLNVSRLDVDGKAYFVYDNVILVGSKGLKGDKGDKGDGLDVSGLTPDDYLEKSDAELIDLDGLISGTTSDKRVSDLERKVNTKDQEHDVKIATVTAAVNNLEFQLNAIGSTAELTTLKRDVATHNTDITTLKTKVATEEKDIRDLESNKADQSTVTSLDSRLTSSVNGKAAKAEVTAVDTKATKNASEIATMKAKVNSSESLATSARAKANKNETDITDIKTDVTGLTTLTTQHTASIQTNGTDISSLKNAASLLDLMDLSTNLPVTSAKIKAQLVSRGINTPSGDSHAGEFVLVKADPAGATYQFWLADTATAGEWRQASTTMEINLGAYQRKGKNGAAGTGYAPGINMVLVGSTSDDPTWVNVKDALEAAFSFDAIDDNGKTLAIQDGKLVKKTLSLESTDIVLDKDNADTTFAINKGDFLVAGEVATDGKVSKISASAIKPVIAETDAGGVTPVTTHTNKLAIGGANTQNINYLDNPGEEGKVLTSKATGAPEWKTPNIAKGTVVVADKGNIAFIEDVDADGNIKVGKTGITETYITTMRTDVDNLNTDFATLRTDVDDAQLDATTAQSDATQAIGDLADLKLKAFGLADGDDLNKPKWRDVLDGNAVSDVDAAKIANLPDDTSADINDRQKNLLASTLTALGINADSTLIETDNSKPNFVLPFRKTEKDIIDGMVDMKVQPSGTLATGALTAQVAASTMDGTTTDKTLITQKYVDDKEKALQDMLKLKANQSTDWLVTTIETTSPGFFIFDETPAIDALPYEAQVKVEWPTTIPAGFGDTDQVQSLLPGATSTERVILNVAGTNVMNYSELKDDFDKYMIIIKKKGSGTTGAVDENDYWQFVRFENKGFTPEQEAVLNGKPFTEAHEKRLAQIEASGLFLGDIISDKDETEADLITRIDGIFSTAIKGDHVEIIKETDTVGEAIYFLLTKGDTTWTKGAERTEHIKTGASGGAATTGIKAGVNSYTGRLGTFEKFEILAEITTTVPDSTFRNLPNLKTISLPLVTTIGRNAFLTCSVLTSADLPSAITIEASAFSDCAALKTINMPSATTIGKSAFYGVPDAPTTHVTMKSKFNTTAEKNRIFRNAFGGGSWNNITFTWV